MHPAETYLQRLAQLRGLGTDETSGYPALEALFNAVGDTLRPKVSAVTHPRGVGAGIPDGGFFTLDQLRQSPDQSALFTLDPARGVFEVKPVGHDLGTLIRSEQVEGYLQRYGQILLTDYRAFALWHWEGGRAIAGEAFALAPDADAFWHLAHSPRRAAEQQGDRLLDYLRRVLLSRAPLAEPKVLAAFLASYAREARARIGGDAAALEALAPIRVVLEESLGIQFADERGRHFFVSTFVQTLFYGVFSAWVLWHEKEPAPGELFRWKEAAFNIGLPVLRRLFSLLADPQQLRSYGLDEVLDWTADTLNRVDRAAFFARFQLGAAVQYFYEPFLAEFDPALRKQFGVWYTPPEIVKYMVERVDRSLREELHLADGLADPRVVVLDPCCGTGTYLVEVLRHIYELRKVNDGPVQAALSVKTALCGSAGTPARIFGFELLPAPYVVAHLRLDLLLQQLRAPVTAEGERAAVFLTNALTGWEPPREAQQQIMFGEFQAERDAANHVKREARILVILGNPPYDGFAGIAPSRESDREERALSETYRAVHTPGLPAPNGQGLNDLYVRFFRMAERRIVDGSGEGIVCFISNYSWLDGLSHPGMRERLLGAFDSITVDCLNGDKYKTGKRTPDGQPDPSVFSTSFNREGIQVGTAIATLVRAAGHRPPAAIRFRHFWGKEKRAELVASLSRRGASRYLRLRPDVALGLPFVPMISGVDYAKWPSVPELLPFSSFGVLTNRDDALVSIDREPLEARMRRYFDAEVDARELRAIAPSLLTETDEFDPKIVRAYLLTRGIDSGEFVRLLYRPFDTRWLYWHAETKLVERNRADLRPHLFLGNRALAVVKQNRKGFTPPLVVSVFPSHHLIERGANYFPLYLRHAPSESSVVCETPDMFPPGGGPPAPNLSAVARRYLGELGATPETLFFHVVAILHSPAYREENVGALRQDWPRIPLPTDREVLNAGAALGRIVAGLIDPETPVIGVSAGRIRPELRGLGELKTVQRRGQPDLAVTAGWGRQQRGSVMPGRGKLEHLVAESASADSGPWSDRVAVHLNETTYWDGVPREVWDYTLGGYQVLKKWLSYREAPILDRALRPEEAQTFTEIARRIAALLLLRAELDANYVACRQTTAPATREQRGR